MQPTSLPLTIALILLLIVTTFIMLDSDAAVENKREGPLYCHSDGRCTTAAGAFWAEDSLRYEWQRDHPDEALPAHEGA